MFVGQSFCDGSQSRRLAPTFEVFESQILKAEFVFSWLGFDELEGSGWDSSTEQSDRQVFSRLICHLLDNVLQPGAMASQVLKPIRCPRQDIEEQNSAPVLTQDVDFKLLMSSNSVVNKSRLAT